MAKRDQWFSFHLPFFFKQWGGVQKSRTARLVEGRSWEELPSCRAESAGTCLKASRQSSPGRSTVAPAIGDGG